MSGGGGGGRDGWAGPDSGSDCSALSFEAHLSSPDPPVVASLAVGQILRVELQVEERPVVAITREDGVRAGSLTNRIPEMLRCLQAGHQYRAEVLELDGGSVKLRISTAQ